MHKPAPWSYPRTRISAAPHFPYFPQSSSKLTPPDVMGGDPQVSSLKWRRFGRPLVLFLWKRRRPIQIQAQGDSRAGTRAKRALVGCADDGWWRFGRNFNRLLGVVCSTCSCFDRAISHCVVGSSVRRHISVSHGALGVRRGRGINCG